jgi:hypothetical protein
MGLHAHAGPPPGRFLLYLALWHLSCKFIHHADRSKGRIETPAISSEKGSE